MTNLDQNNSSEATVDPIKDKIEQIKGKEFGELPKDFVDIDSNPEVKPILLEIKKLQDEFDNIKKTLSGKYTEYAQTNEVYLKTLAEIAAKTTQRDAQKQTATNTTDTKTAQNTNNLTKELADLDKTKNKLEIELKGLDGKTGLTGEITKLETDLKTNNTNMITKIGAYKDKVLEVSKDKVSEYETKIANFVKTKLEPQSTKLGEEIKNKIGNISANEEKVSDMISTETGKTKKENKNIEKTNNDTQKLFADLENAYSDYISYAYAGQSARLNIYEFQKNIWSGISGKYNTLFSNISTTENFLNQQKDYFNLQKTDLLSRKGSVYTKLASESLKKYKSYSDSLEEYANQTKDIKTAKGEIEKVSTIAELSNRQAIKDFEYQIIKGQKGYYDFGYNYYLKKSEFIDGEMNKISQSQDKENLKKNQATLTKLEQDFKDKKISEETYITRRGELEEQIEKDTTNIDSQKQSYDIYKAKLQGTKEDRGINAIRQERAGNAERFEKQLTSKELGVEAAAQLTLDTTQLSQVKIDNGQLKNPITEEAQRYRENFEKISKLQTYIPGKDKKPTEQKPE